MLVFDLFSQFGWIFISLAAGSSFFYGWFACKIHDIQEDGKAIDEKNKHLSWRIHQFWLNFVGSAVGWMALWLLGGAIFTCAGVGCENPMTPTNATLFLLGFLGVTGYLPAALVGLVAGSVSWSRALLEKLAK